jgi:hypothetical protein
MGRLRRLVLVVGLVILVLAGGGLLWTQAQKSSPGPNPANVPPVGTIWFGRSFDTTTFELSGQADTFGQSGQIAMVAHLSRKIPGGQAINVAVDGVIVKSDTSSSDYDLFGLTWSAEFFATGTHSIAVQDVGGTTLASGIVAVTP